MVGMIFVAKGIRRMVRRECETDVQGATDSKNTVHGQMTLSARGGKIVADGAESSARELPIPQRYALELGDFRLIRQQHIAPCHRWLRRAVLPHLDDFL